MQAKKIERKDSAFNRYKSEMFVDIAEVDGKDEEGSSSDDLKHINRKGVMVSRRQTQEIRLLSKNILSTSSNPNASPSKAKKQAKLKMDETIPDQSFFNVSERQQVND